MRKTIWAGALVCAAVSFHAATAAATPVDDLRAGTSVLVESAAGTIDDVEASEGGHEIAKASGSLAFSVDRAAFGLGAGPPIPVTGTEIDGDTIELSVSHVFSPIVESGDLRVSSVVGSLKAKVLSLHGSVAPSCGGASCAYSVRLEVLDGGKLTIEGAKKKYMTWWSFTKEAVSLKGLALGGVPRPSLFSFDLTAPEKQCADSLFSKRTYVGRVRLTTPASTDGAAVDIESSDPKLLPPFRAVVPPGKDTITFPVTFSASDGGLFAFRASSGGSVATKYLDVRSCMADMTRYPGFTIDPAPWEPICGPCVEAVHETDSGFATFKAGGEWFFSDPDGQVVPLDSLVGGDVIDARPGPLGDLAGSAYMGQGQLSSFRLTGWAFAPQLEQGPYAASPFVSARGTVFAIEASQGQAGVIALGDGGLWPVPVPASAYEIAGLLGSEELVVNGWSANGPRAYVADGVGATELPAFGYGLRVVGVSATGAMVASATDPQGGEQVLYFPPGPPLQPLPLPVLPGIVQVAPVGIDDDGVVLVNGYTAQGDLVPYLVAPGVDPVPLAGQIDTNEDLVIQDAVSITPGGRVVVHALRDGEPAFVLLHPTTEL